MLWSISRDSHSNMAEGMVIDKHFALMLYLSLFLIGNLVLGERCPQQKEGSNGAPNTNEKARTLAGLQFKFTKGKYIYTIKFCEGSLDYEAVTQDEKKPNGTKIRYVLGRFNGMKVYGGTDWLMVEYGNGDNYRHHCVKGKRRSIFYIQCDRSADTYAERTPKYIEEDTTEGCYYLFEMKYDGVCPPEKSKISPGSVFIIILVIIGVLYLLLGFLYQRFIVGAKGMEQIPNYLMWREFGTLQADGCNYFCRCKGTREPTRYKPMDDAIADEDDFTVENSDNDDAMLPM